VQNRLFRDVNKIVKKICGTPEGHQKSIFNTSKEKKTKMHMASIRQSLQAQLKTEFQTKILKKNVETPNLPIKSKIFTKRLCVVP
jgi:hypothetical protein